MHKLLPNGRRGSSWPVARRFAGWRATWSQDRRRARGAHPDGSNWAVGQTHYWPLTEASGTRYDYVGTVDLTDHGGVTSAVVDGRAAAVFSRANQQYLSAAGNQLRFHIPFSCAFWARANDAANEYVFLSKDEPAGREFSVQSGSDLASLHPYAYTQASGSFGMSAVAALTWFHFALTFDGATLTLYFDGTPAAQATGIPTLTYTEFRVGARVYPGFENYLDGQMADLRMWGRALTAAEVATVFDL